MLTPSFELQQNKDFLTIIIKAPFAKVAETEIFIEENAFKFYSKPYFLRLTLPGNIVEDGREKADYDVEKGVFTVVVPKETSGEHFEGLDMLTKLLAPQKKTKDVCPLIEVINDDDDDDDNNQGNGDDDNDDDFDWCIEQEPYEEKQGLLETSKYGFANQKSGVFQRLQEEMMYVVDCPDPDQCNVTDRRKLRLETEWEKFDEDHYLADFLEDENIKQILNYKPRFYDEVKCMKDGQSVEKIIEFDDEEKDVLKKLPRKEYILDSIEESHVYLGLVDIIYAYVYNHRCTEGENHCESGWTISKISATLSWMEVFTSIKEVIQSCYRRSLCYPLYRHWCLNDTVLQDVIQILTIGKRCLLKILLEIRSIMIDQENRYILNDLYITDYCVWIQSASSKKLQSLAQALSKMTITKEEIGFNLPDIEQLAMSALHADNNSDIDSIENKLQNTTLNDTCKDDNDDDDDDGETDDDETDDDDGGDDDEDDEDDDDDDSVATDGDDSGDDNDVCTESNEHNKICQFDDTEKKSCKLIEVINDLSINDDTTSVAVGDDDDDNKHVDTLTDTKTSETKVESKPET